MITNQAVSAVRENVITDTNADLKVEPNKTVSVSREQAILLDKSIVARPLMAPEVSSIHVKNTEYAYRWVNHDGMKGQFYQKRKSQGFTNATTDDVDVLGGDATATNGEIRAGDLILMKIRQDIYDAALKHNMQQAYMRQAMRGVYVDGASADVMSDSVPKRMSVSQEPFAKGGMATPFIPDNPDAIVNDSIQSGRVTEARKVVDELRSKAGK
jgi:hypothetical protein